MRHQKPENLTLGILQMIASAFFFSIMGALAKNYVGQFHPMEVVFFRSIVAVVFMLPIMIWHRIPLIGRDHLNLFVRAVSGFLALSLSFYVIAKMDIANAVVLNQTSPIFVVILSGFLLKEKISFKLALHVAVAFIGILMIIKPGVSISSLPGFLGALSGFFAAIAYVAIKKMMNREHPYTIIFAFTIVSSFLSLLFFPKFTLPTPEQSLHLIALGIAATIAQILMTISYRHGPASVISPFSFSNILFATLVGAFFWREIPDHLSFLGGALIIATGISLMRLGQKSETVVQFHGLR